ncbi:hypothetical protein DVH05_016938 [Phytophthora capsici]|nr:hypothetical protein DVH05_016938 [Phytophthora capsici]
MPDSTPKGWVRMEVAELSPDNGGVGIPNMVTELMALSASMVGKWALSEDVLERQVGRVFQDAGAEHAKPLTVGGGPPPKAVKRSPWATGRPWVELWMASRGPTATESRKGAEGIRILMRARHGLQTRWNNKGLVIMCSGKLRAKMMEVVKARRSLYGDF